MSVPGHIFNSIDLSSLKDKMIYMIVLNIPGTGEYREYFTPMPWGEYKKVVKRARLAQVKEYELEEWIFRDYVIRRRPIGINDLDDLPFGVVSTIARVILAISDTGTLPDEKGDLDLERLENQLDVFRYLTITSVDVQLFTLICSVFKGYTFEDLQKLTSAQVKQLYTAAERHLLNIRAITEPLRFISLEEKEKKPEKEVKSAYEVIKEKMDAEFNDEDQNDEDLEGFDEEEEDEEDARYYEEQKRAALAAIEAKQAQQRALAEKAKQRPASKPQAPVEAPKVAPMMSWEEFLEEGLSKINKKNPKYDIFVERETKRLRTIWDARQGKIVAPEGYIAPQHQTAPGGGSQIVVPGIDLKSSGFRSSDFQVGPEMMSEEDAMIEAEKAGYAPAGSEILDNKKEKEKEIKKQKLREVLIKETTLADGKEKKLSLREQKLLREKLRGK